MDRYRASVPAERSEGRLSERIYPSMRLLLGLLPVAIVGQALVMVPPCRIGSVPKPQPCRGADHQGRFYCASNRTARQCDIPGNHPATCPPCTKPPPPPPPQPQWYPRAPCVDNTDCALNGECSAGACKCGSGWTGASCETLELMPAPAFGSYGWDPNISSWGGHVLKMRDTYHMYVAELWGDCGIDSWGRNCHVVHAEASSPEGPFVYRDTALGPFSCNPHAIATGDGDAIALFHIGDAVLQSSPLINCSGRPAHPPDPLPSEQWPNYSIPGTFHTAPGPSGPWTPKAGPDCNNPAPAHHRNGTWYLVCHDRPELTMWSTASLANSTETSWTFVGNIMDSSNTPVVNGTPTQWISHTTWEDPHLWIDLNGHFHIICHAYPPVDSTHPYDYGDVVAGHGFSSNGIHWTWSTTPPYTRYVQHSATKHGVSAELLKYGTRERPFLLLEEGVPVALYTAVTYPNTPNKQGPNDASFTLMQPVKH